MKKSTAIIKIRKTPRRNIYEAESISTAGKFYTVDLNKSWCSCPDYRFRESKLHTKCKHILAVEEKYGIKARKKKTAKSKSAAKKVKTKKQSTGIILDTGKVKKKY